ncbi:kinesin-like protein KIF17 isoform X2 [Brienomyrus brachyistius]|uniref:kinesin-like protein KIF17 isoform X2 n=1 Tax=Brienomyrus brachyistius TaxID=42636 RepID=UPI0020B30B47|nr:kinesin-like protein KIF17 isoform X2 [Brienomyrus brachyistius]
MASESVKVVVRCRPMNDRERALSCKAVVLVDSDRGQCFIEKPGAAEEPPKQFTFEGAYCPQHTTEQMYNEVAYPLVEGVTEGYNGTIFAYGQTGSGKSFTMQGVAEPPAYRGVIPRAFEHIFETIQCTENTKFLVRTSYLEIYNEEVRDLLGNDTKQKMELKEHPEHGIYVRNLSMRTVHSVTECERLMEQGWRNRSVGCTLMNKDSSRSHSIFTIHMEICSTDAVGEGRLRAGKLNLVDLAGSERQSKTGAMGERLREATKINLSLSALGNVISALVDGRSRHVPYRDSKLTRLLQDSLGGNTRTLMVACLSPADNNYEESLSTLRYAHRAKSIQNRPRVNEDPKDALLREYQDEINYLRTLLSGQLGGSNIPSLLAGAKSEGPPASRSEAEKERMKQDYEEKLARLQAEYHAEQESNAKLQEDIVTLRTSYEARLSGLEKLGVMKAININKGNAGSSVSAEEEECQPETAASQAVTAMEHSLAQVSQPEVAQQVSSVREDPEGTAHRGISPVSTTGALEQKHALKRLQQLEQEFVGGEEARNEDLQRRHRQRKRLADQRKKQLAEAMAEGTEDTDGVLLRVYDSIQEEVHAKNRLLEATQGKLKAARLEIRDLQREFELERDDYLANIRRLEREAQLLQGILERVLPLVRRDCNYSCVERLRKEAMWDEDSATWRLPEVVVQKTVLPSMPTAQTTGSQSRLPAVRTAVADNGESFAQEEDRYKELLSRSNSENIASNYFKCRRASELLATEPKKSVATHSAPLSNGTSLVVSAQPAESQPPRPFRLESLGLDTASLNSRVKRKKSRTHIPRNGS